MVVSLLTLLVSMTLFMNPMTKGYPIFSDIALIDMRVPLLLSVSNES